MFCYGRFAKRRIGQGAVSAVWLAIRCSILSVFSARSSCLLHSSVLAEKCLAKVGQVVSQGAPQRHAFDFAEAAYGQRRQPAIGS
jgi:hypothetical protein